MAPSGTAIRQCLYFRSCDETPRLSRLNICYIQATKFVVLSNPKKTLTGSPHKENWAFVRLFTSLLIPLALRPVQFLKTVQTAGGNDNHMQTRLLFLHHSHLP